MQYSLPKGTFDIIPQETDEVWKNSSYWAYLEKIIRDLAYDYGFKEIRTPIFEKTELFTRVVGETSDIVSKEMYTFLDKADRSMSLRPEGTAPAIRALIENNLCVQNKFQKVFYIGPYFRYDRPQAGRFRQFHQFGVEAIGPSDPEQDVEIIDMLMQLYARLNIKNLKVLINSVGNSTSREAYAEALKAFLKKHFDSLTEDSKIRFEKNPLRILDTKDPKEKEILKEAPSILNYLDEESTKHFEKVLALLDKLHIPYKIDHSLVRGLDYYNKTVFEVISSDLGAQSTIGAGGRYDGLMKTLGGPDLPSIGFATGIERILVTMHQQGCLSVPTQVPFVYYLPLDSDSKELATILSAQTRHNKIPTEILLKDKKMQKALADVETSGASYCVIIGEEERKNHMAQVKNMHQRESITISLDALQKFLADKWSQKNHTAR